MIIEIKNLPDGRKVKHISVDISFEEDNICVSTEINDCAKTEASKSIDLSKNISVDTVVTSPIIAQTDRVKKDVPPEMKDLEF